MRFTLYALFCMRFNYCNRAASLHRPRTAQRCRSGVLKNCAALPVSPVPYRPDETGVRRFLRRGFVERSLAKTKNGRQEEHSRSTAINGLPIVVALRWMLLRFGDNVFLRVTP